ncbi:DUF4391 domain-containing protein [Saccharibacillus sp. CPCC 101409]|uniref:DUF4391 domain-containing protein n=1 Tax=Saccharibacillus sp. CPCC 101409 TaxID=3058041 RepID=UPI0026724ECD|nr:DUF4391 domain-containing protein [Saccharibacillus sp. CPCC 101409]MDO3409888.1 DUF4391 domain-containing protein [Saccharibacillus sp. CPCC 101409]
MKLKLPSGTLVDKKIPKNKFYEKLHADSGLKELFTRQVDSVVWKHKLSPATIRLEARDGIDEIQIFEIVLRQREYSPEILRGIDRAIPYPILYVLRCGRESKLAIAYKERSESDENRAVVRSYHESQWRPEDGEAGGAEFEVLHGLDLKAVYEHIVRSLVSITGESETSSESASAQTPASLADNLPLEELLERKSRIEALGRECLRLETKVRKEKQYNRQVELNMQLQRKRKELAALRNGDSSLSGGELG